MNPLPIGSRQLGDGHPVYIAFEIGPTVRGIGSAMRMLTVAAGSGADAIKVQVLDAERLVGDPAHTVSWLEWDGVRRTAPMREVLAARSLLREEWIGFRAEAGRLELDVIATIDFPETLEFAANVLGVDALKVCSGDVAHPEWVREVAAVGLPVMIDTGSATLGEVERAAEACVAAGNTKLVIHHCPSGYPARVESVNLRVLTTLRQMFPEFPAAFSDHVPGATMDVAAVALGAAMIEKTLTEDRRQHGPEHVMSIEPGEAREFVQTIRDTEASLGRPRRRLTEAEEAGKLGARRSLYARRLLLAGDSVSGALEWRRPGGGIGPAEWAMLASRGLVVARRRINEGERVELEALAW